MNDLIGRKGHRVKLHNPPSNAINLRVEGQGQKRKHDVLAALEMANQVVSSSAECEPTRLKQVQRFHEPPYTVTL